MQIFESNRLCKPTNKLVKKKTAKTCRGIKKCALF